MNDRLTFWLGADAEHEWNTHLERCEAEAEEQRHRREEIDE